MALAANNINTTSHGRNSPAGLTFCGSGPRFDLEYEMHYPDLDAASKSASYLAGMAGPLYDLLVEGNARHWVKDQIAEVNRKLPEARAAIHKMQDEFRWTRDSALHLGDVVASTAHEFAVQMVFLLNRRLFGIEVVGERVEIWPNHVAVVAEIDLENARATLFRMRSGIREQPTIRRLGRPKKAESTLEAKVIATLTAHHGYESGSVTNYSPISNRALAEMCDVSANSLSRFLENRGGDKGYKAACANGTIGFLLMSWLGENPSGRAQLRDEEWDRDGPRPGQRQAHLEE
jgi:hypothetical protein